MSNIAPNLFTPGNMGALSLPLSWAEGRPRIVYGHGAGGDAREWAGKPQFGVPAVVAIAQRIRDEGFAGACPSTPFLYGNGIDQALRLDAVEALEALGATGPIVTMGTSGGNIASLLFYADHPQLPIACHVGFLPVVDVAAQRVPEPAGINGLRPSIDQALGIAWPQPVPAISDPNQRRSELMSLPQLYFLPRNDPHSVNVQDYADHVGATVINVDSDGHTNDSIAAADLDVAFEFIRNAIALMAQEV